MVLLHKHGLEEQLCFTALGIDESRAKSAIRFGLGRFTTKEEIDYAVECISEMLKISEDAFETTSGEHVILNSITSQAASPPATSSPQELRLGPSRRF